MRTSPTLWYCAAEYVLAKGESIPLILLEEPSPFRQDIIAALETARVSWHLAHGASSLSGVKAAVKAGLGVTARPVEMMSPDLRVAGISEGLLALPDTRYVVSCNPRTVSELPQAILQSLSQEIHPWETGTALTPEEGGNTLV
ncbi:LysR substrate-binding domain-containing protein, partial [Klebsiella variicola]|uniref:LysR substrate-binding domain-containing protein n=1 Tax=Klebsiella variicola TaxID=244366 RepID=UPI001F5F8FA8